MIRTSVEKAFDEAVAPNGVPSDRAQEILLRHEGLMKELYEAGVILSDTHGDELNPLDTFLAGFIAGLIWSEDNT